MQSVEGGYGATVGETASEEPDVLIVPGARIYDLVRSANSHTGPQLHRCIRGRTDGSIRLGANLLQKPLALGGASTDEYTPFLITNPPKISGARAAASAFPRWCTF